MSNEWGSEEYKIKRAEVPGGWLACLGPEDSPTFVPNVTVWVEALAQATACKACKGTGKISYQNQYASTTQSVCNACNGKGR